MTIEIFPCINFLWIFCYRAQVRTCNDVIIHSTSNEIHGNGMELLLKPLAEYLIGLSNSRWIILGYKQSTVFRPPKQDFKGFFLKEGLWWISVFLSQVSTHEWSVNAWNFWIQYSNAELAPSYVETTCVKRFIPCFWNMPMQIVSLFSSRKQILHQKSVIWSLYRSILVCRFARSVIYI